MSSWYEFGVLLVMFISDFRSMVAVAVVCEMWRAPSRDLLTIHLRKCLGSPQCMTLDALQRKLANLSKSEAEVTAIVKSSMLIATKFAAVLLVLCKRHVSASDW